MFTIMVLTFPPKKKTKQKDSVMQIWKKLELNMHIAKSIA